MSDFTDEQIEAALGAYRDALLVKTGAGIHCSLDREIPAMRAALHTLGPISVHEPTITHHNGEQIIICKSCAEIEAAVLDTYAPNNPYDAAVWPCPAAQAHEKENHA